MYLQYFGLTENPFSITPDPRYLYLSERHREALAHLVYGVGEGGGFVLLTGEVGTGKTTVCRTLLEQVPQNVSVALILNPRLDSTELLAAVCDDLGIEVPPAATIKQLVDRLNSHLLATHAEGRRTVLIIDEAQNLSPDVLEQVRLLTNLETATHKLLQVFLIGQPELRELLGREEMRQVAQRITARYHLSALAPHEVADYVRHRLAVAGCERPIVSRAAFRTVYALTGGIPRLINILCDRALLGTYVHGRQSVEPDVVRGAARELGYDLPARARAPRPALVGLLLVSIALAAGFTLYRDRLPQFLPLDAVAPEPAAAVVAPVAASAPTALPRQLDELAADSDPHGERDLLTLWGIQYDGVDLCGIAERSGLRCYEARGTWNTLRRFNRPALIALEDEGTVPILAVVSKLDADTVTLLVGGKPRTLPLATADRWWLGRFTLLWRPPAGPGRLLRPGDTGPTVRWVRRALASLGDLDVGAPDSALFDAPLQKAITEFQWRRGLQVDGLVGTETLLHLQSLLTDVGDPTLAPPSAAAGT